MPGNSRICDCGKGLCNVKVTPKSLKNLGRLYYCCPMDPVRTDFNFNSKNLFLELRQSF